MSKRPNKRTEEDERPKTKISSKYDMSSSSDDGRDDSDLDDFLVRDIELNDDEDSSSKNTKNKGIMAMLQRQNQQNSKSNDPFSNLDLDTSLDDILRTKKGAMAGDIIDFSFMDSSANANTNSDDVCDINFDHLVTSAGFDFNLQSGVSKFSFQPLPSTMNHLHDEYGSLDDFQHDSGMDVNDIDMANIDTTSSISTPTTTPAPTVETTQKENKMTTEELKERRKFDQNKGIGVAGALSDEIITYAHETDETLNVDQNALSSMTIDQQISQRADINISLQDLTKFSSHYIYVYSIYEDHNSRDGKLYLFGRILLQNNDTSTSSTSANPLSDTAVRKVYKSEDLITKSICISVERVDRQMFFLPRKYQKDRYGNVDKTNEVTIEQVKDQIMTLLNDRDISNQRVRVVKKKYVFGRRVATSSFLQHGQTAPTTVAGIKRRGKKMNTALSGDNFNFDDDINNFLSDSEDEAVPHQTSDQVEERDTDGNIIKKDLINQGISTAKSMKRDESLLDPINIIPHETTYVEVRYPSSYQSLPQNLNNTTFSHILGTQASRQENFIVDRKLLGPCWIRISSQYGKLIDRNNFSWCDFEMNVPEARFIEVYSPAQGEPDYPPPLFTSVSLSIKTAVRLTTSNTYEKHIVMATIKTDYSSNIDISKTKGQQLKTFENTWTVIAPPPDRRLPFDFETKRAGWNEGKKRLNGEIHVAPNETKLLQILLHTLHRRNPDIIVGHDLHGSMIDILISRFQAHKLGQQWSKFGRLKRSVIPKHGTGTSRSLVDNGVGAGRLLVDTQLSAREFFPSKQYTLDYLTDQLLELRIKTIDQLQVGDSFLTTQSLFDLIGINILDAESQFRLMHNLDIIPLTKQLTNLCGNTWHSSLRSSRAERVEYLLLHTFTRENFIPPEPATLKLTPFNTVDLDPQIATTTTTSTTTSSSTKTTAKNKAKKRRVINNEGDEAVDDFAENFIAESDDEEGHARQETAQEQQTGTHNASSAAVPTKKKAGYSGGKVLEPKRGFYNEWIAVLDFNSLYPSIIREYNLCFSTTQHWAIDIDVPDPDFDNFVPSSQVTTGILPNVVRMLIERRRAVRSLITRATSPHDKQMYHIKQLALKLVANSLYGCLGFASSRFYCRPLAACVTSKGRQALDNAVATAGSLGANIIYGDTDSIMVNTQAQTHRDAREVAVRLKSAINKQYKVLTIDEDGYFKNMLLLRKKKYAAMKLEKVEKYDENLERAFHQEQQTRLDARKYFLQVMPNISLIGKDISINDPSLQQRNDIKEMFYFKREVKGLDMVRRDWSNLCRTASEMVLDIILRDDGRRDDTIAAIKLKLSEINQLMTENKLPVDNYAITKQLTRSLEQYADASKLPHVAVALRSSKRGKLVRAGDVIEYVMTSSQSTQGGSQSDRAVSKDEYIGFLRHMKQQEDLLAKTGNTDTTLIQPYLDYPSDIKIDLIYYKEQQLLAPIMRLVDVMEEISQPMLADCLGLDSAKYAVRERNQQSTGTHHSIEEESWGDDPYEQFRDLPPLYISCPRCSCAFPFLGVYSYIPYARMHGYFSSPPHLRDPINYWTLPFKMHTRGYLNKINDAQYNKTGFICPTPGCPGLFDFGQMDHSNQKNDKFTTPLSVESISALLCNTVNQTIRDYISQFEQHQFVYNSKDVLNTMTNHNAGSTQYLSTEVKINGACPEYKSITQLDIITLLQYLSHLFDYSKHRVNLQRECDSRLNRKLGTGPHSKQLLLAYNNDGILPDSKQKQPQNDETIGDLYFVLKMQAENEVRIANGTFQSMTTTTQLPSTTWTASATELACCHLNSDLSPEIIQVLNNVHQEIKKFFHQDEFFTIELTKFFGFLQESF